MPTRSRALASALLLIAAAVARADVSVGPSKPGLRRHPGACGDFHDFKFPTHVGADGIPDSVVRRTFDREGRPASEDWQRDDAPHRRLTFHYDAAGRLAREELRVVGGALVSITTHRYDGAGHEIEIGIDENADGKPDWLTIKTWDRDGRLATMRENVKAGTSRRGLGHWYRYDADGRLALEKVDNDGDGEPNFDIRYRYDERGLLAEKHSHWYEKNGPIDEVFTYAYDGERRLVAETDRLGFTWTYRYDDAGNLLVKTREVPPQLVDRTPMVRITYDYSCW
jgi:YD repeat-containing protein